MTPVAEKACTKCGLTLPLGDYHKNSQARDGLRANCKTCHRALIKARTDRPGQRDHERATQKASRLKLRAEVLTAYGAACTCCGESTDEFLSIDHVNNDGAAHRSEIRSNLYHWLRKNGFPKDRFQILCHNCNMAKGFYGGCPHAAFKLEVAA